MQFTILTTFPDYFKTPLESSIVGRAINSNKISVSLINIRDFAKDQHRTTDDRPFGGGAGMVMKIEPIDLALQSVKQDVSSMHRSILLSARGKRLDQTDVVRLSKYQSILLICGHYGDVDQRVADNLVNEEVSIGDFIMTGGEPGALVLVDAITRLLPGVVNNEASIKGESHTEPGMKSHPNYTRPATYKDWQVPEVLLSGNRAAIETWKKIQRKITSQ